MAACDCTVHKPVCRPAFVFSLLMLLLSVVWFAFCAHGMAEIPKCRYGEKECYYRVPDGMCDHTGAYCNTYYLVNMRVEGSADNSLEQFAIPLIASLASLLPPILVFVGTVCPGQLGSLEAGKCFLTGVTVMSVVGIYIVQNLTFECRWWNQPNQDKCKEGFNMYVAGSFFNILTQIILLVIAIIIGESERAGSPEEQSLNDDQKGDAGAAQQPYPSFSTTNGQQTSIQMGGDSSIQESSRLEM